MSNEENKTITLTLANGPDAFLKNLLDAVQIMIEEGQPATKILDQINVVSGFFLQDRDVRVKYFN